MRRILMLGLVVVLLWGCSQNDPVVVTPTQGRTAIELPTSTPLPSAATPTFVPTFVSTSAAIQPSLALPTAGNGTSGGSAGAPTGSTGTANTFRFEDTAWTGGWRNRGDSRYKGRTATWIYGANTAYNTMRTTFSLSGQPSGHAELQIMGMDSEDGAKTPILMTVNGQQIFRGPNPLPNDDNDLPLGTWALVRFPFSASLLRAGSNTITIQNLANGQIGLPPFFMLDYADLVLQP